MSPAKTPSQEALNDILDAFDKQWDIGFTTEGLQAAIALFDGSLGKYLRGIEKENNGRDVWGEADLKELPNFILGYVIAEIAFGLRNETGGNDVDESTITRVASDVMTDQKTLDYCDFVVKSYQKKVKIPKAPTPICSTDPFQGK